MNRRETFKVLAAGAAALMLGNRDVLAAVAKKRMTVYKSPTCGCCNAWVKHVRAAGYDVKAIDVDDVTPYKTKYGISQDLASCHTGVVDGYAIEGHVPADLIDRLLREKPKNARGLAVPGMPMGSPGMEMGGHKDAYNVMLIDRTGKATLYAKR
jgi:hypothetical protein